jgi:hypothetical protein
MIRAGFRLSIPMDAAFCVETLEGAHNFSRTSSHGSGQPVHGGGLHRRADQTCDRYQHGQQGFWHNNVFVKQLWRSVRGVSAARRIAVVAVLGESIAQAVGFNKESAGAHSF